MLLWLLCCRSSMDSSGRNIIRLDHFALVCFPWQLLIQILTRCVHQCFNVWVYDLHDIIYIRQALMNYSSMCRHAISSTVLCHKIKKLCMQGKFYCDESYRPPDTLELTKAAKTYTVFQGFIVCKHILHSNSLFRINIRFKHILFQLVT